MGKNSQHDDSGIPIPNTGPGCMWGVLHFLNYHHWRYIKKRFPHIRVGNGGSKRVLGARDGNSENDITSENSKSTVEDEKMPSSPKAKGSVKSLLKLLTDELSKKKCQHHRSTTYPTRSHLTRTDSIHHLEPIEGPFGCIELNNGSPRIVHDNGSFAPSSLDPLVPKPLEDPNCEEYGTMPTDKQLEDNQVDKNDKQPFENHSIFEENLEYRKQNLIPSKNLNTDDSTQHSLEIANAPDMINMNKELFEGILQNPCSPLAHHFHSQQALSNNMTYAKNVSFPLLGSSDRKGRSGKFKHNQPGIESPAKEGKLQAVTQTQKSFESKSQVYSRSHSTSSVVMSEIGDNLYSTSPHHLKKHGGNQVVMNRFKDLRQKIKHAIKESKNEKHRITMDAILHKIPHRHGFSKDLKKEIIDLPKNRYIGKDGKESPPRRSYESDRSLPFTFKSDLHCFSRTSSFSESLDRYSQLYEFSFGRESKHRYAETPKLRSENVAATHMKASKSMRRILSLPNMKYNEVSYDAFPSGHVKTFSDATASEQLPHSDINHNLQCDIPYNLGIEPYSTIEDCFEKSQDSHIETDAKEGSISDDFGSLIMSHEASQDKQDICPETKTVIELEEPSIVLVPDSKFSEATSSPSRLCIAEEEGSDFYVKQIHPSTVDSLDDKLTECRADTPIKTGHKVKKTEFSIKNSKDEIMQFQVDAKDKAEFDYVRDILKISGFSENELLGTWHADNQPVDPSVYEEVEGCMLLDPKCSGNEEGGNCHHLLLFDLINEVLMEIYAKSCACYPTPLSSLSHIRPMPVGYHVLEEVWADISWYLCSCPDADQLLDYIISRDLAKNDGWMNLQYEAECVGIELEEWILDDLLDEAFCI